MELFDLKVMKMDSPRLAWLKKHKISTHRSPYVELDEEPWSCWSGPFEEAVMHKGDYTSGMTEDQAITRWALKYNVRLWNEE
jgi:hypothetical protein